jgi:hypothetical protein
MDEEIEALGLLETHRPDFFILGHIHDCHTSRAILGGITSGSRSLSLPVNY